MTPAAWLGFAGVFPDAMLLLSMEGVVLAANAAAQRLAGGSPVGRHLVELVEEPRETIERWLGLWGRTPTLTLGALRWRQPEGPAVPCRADGARILPGRPDEAPMILLWCRPKGDEETTSRFIALNERIAALGREIAVRTRAESELREQREWLRVTLASIGDAVVTTDREGRVTFMNGVAEALTGWAMDEAAGRPVGEVIKLLNEQTREPADGPIARVLRDGRVAGLANHTLLIDRRGREHPIDDSAAPIAGAGGPVIGVVMVFHDISERQRLQRELRLQLEELAEVDRRKDDFLAMLGHELRNPLAAIANAMAVRRAVGSDEPSYERAGQVVERQVAVLERLVDDLVDVARIRRGAVELRRHPFDLRVAVERAMEAAQPAIAAGELTAVTVQAPAPLTVDADPIRMEQVIANLLSNACRYTARGGHIEVSTAAEGDRAVVAVRDTGEGIEPSLLSTIFEPFVQGRRPLHRPQGGLGIGLTLVRTLVEMHDGRVEVTSAGPGHGSTFRVWLPRLTPAVQPPAPPEVSAPGFRIARVLVVDDHADSADMLAMLLRSRGHEVEVAHDGPTALAAAARFRPRLVLLDIGLPGMDGYAVAAALRGMRALEPLRLVALTGYGQPQDRERSRDAGFDLHLVKPVTVEKLQEIVSAVAEE